MQSLDKAVVLDPATAVLADANLVLFEHISEGRDVIPPSNSGISFGYRLFQRF